MSDNRINELKENLSKGKLGKIRFFYFFALASSLTGAILMLSGPMYGSYWGYGVYVYIGAGYAPIAGGAALLIFCFIIALVGIYGPWYLKKYKLHFIGIFLPLLELVLSLAGLGYASTEFSGVDWWLEAGFYGSVIPGPLTAVFFIINSMIMRKI